MFSEQQQQLKQKTRSISEKKVDQWGSRLTFKEHFMLKRFYIMKNVLNDNTFMFHGLFFLVIKYIYGLFNS